MNTSQNGWPALDNDSSKLHTWVIPTRAKHGGESHIRMRNGSAGFLLAHLALWLSEHVEPMAGVILDDWGYAYRPVRGFSTTLSNHASGTAMDFNATKHPLGKTRTWTRRQMRKIRNWLAWRAYRKCIRWGGDYHNRKDEMHFEINRELHVCERAAKRLMRTARGRRILKANPGQRRVILS